MDIILFQEHKNLQNIFFYKANISTNKILMIFYSYICQSPILMIFLIVGLGLPMKGQ